MTQLHEQSHAAELERQQLIKQCHCLVAAIANRPGSTKLLRGILPTLEVFAAYKANRTRIKKSKVKNEDSRIGNANKST